ncbi:MAG TPA: 3-isopropylmalate dehydratase large subunit [Candidatus Dormibacteraeota bacterium]|jgi:3-isopropylmalate/(R)-2-methylmalate dehydratase large subunit/methanogen homoaconitase large subunit
MGTLTEEIFSRRLGRTVHAGDTVIAGVDVAMAHDVTGPLAIEAFRQLGSPLWDASRIVFNFDHVMPANTVAAAELHRVIREFCVEHSITNLFAEGICHQVMIDRGLARPGGVVVGADSHSTTYGGLGCFATGLGSTDIGVVFATGQTWFRIPETVRIDVRGALPDGVYAKDLALHAIRHLGADGADYCAVEWTGEAVRAMSVDERLTLCNLSTDFGAKTGLVEPDEVTLRHTGGGAVDLHAVRPDYARTLVIDAGTLRPQIAVHPSIDNVHDIDEVSGTPLDEVFIGSCTNGRLSDLALAAAIFAGRTVHPNTRTIVVPASRGVYLDALSAGYIEIFARAGALVLNPGCGPCLGRQHGVVGPGERVLSTSNRNYPGRMGSPDAQIFLASPAVAAASAVTGAITDPASLGAVS